MPPEYSQTSEALLRALTNPHVLAILPTIGFGTLWKASCPVTRQPARARGAVEIVVDLIECDLPWFVNCPLVSLKNLRAFPVTIVHNAEHEEPVRFVYRVEMIDNTVVGREDITSLARQMEVVRGNI